MGTRSLLSLPITSLVSNCTGKYNHFFIHKDSNFYLFNFHFICVQRDFTPGWRLVRYPAVGLTLWPHNPARSPPEIDTFLYLFDWCLRAYLKLFHLWTAVGLVEGGNDDHPQVPFRPSTSNSRRGTNESLPHVSLLATELCGVLKTDNP